MLTPSQPTIGQTDQNQTSTYWFEVNGKYLGKAYTTHSAIKDAFDKDGMTYAFLPGNLVSIYGIRKHRFSPSQ